MVLQWIEGVTHLQVVGLAPQDGFVARMYFSLGFALLFGIAPLAAWSTSGRPSVARVIGFLTIGIGAAGIRAYMHAIMANDIVPYVANDMQKPTAISVASVPMFGIPLAGVTAIALLALLVKAITRQGRSQSPAPVAA